MAGGGYLRLVISGALTLAASLAVQRAEAVSSAENESQDCGVEESACFNDSDDCYGCVVGHNETIYEECLEASTDIVDSSTSSVACDYSSLRVPCCMDEASERACMDDDEFLEYMQCITIPSGCSISDLSCSGNGSLEGESPENPSDGETSSTKDRSGTYWLKAFITVVVGLALCWCVVCCCKGDSASPSVRYVPSEYRTNHLEVVCVQVTTT